jgi:hypothetical protein
MTNVSSKTKISRKIPKKRSQKHLAEKGKRKSKRNSKSKKKVYHLRHYGHQQCGRTTKSVAPKRYYGRKYYGPRYSPLYERKSDKKKQSKK